MKRFKLALAVALVAGWVFLASGKPGKKAGPMLKTVVNHRGHVRQEPKFLSPVRFHAAHTDRLEVLEVGEAWSRVRRPGSEESGWIHRSALRTREIALEPLKKQVRNRIKKGDMALAGRGFRTEVEDAYRKKHGELAAAYAWLDEHAGADSELVPAVEAIARFRAEGDLRPLNGGPS